ncbi:MAG TPA: hypothetical protein VK731_14615 [Candidatus Cybelea sp.]|nr:hypothetical protein [Candidatus Cybelea sp.]
MSDRFDWPLAFDAEKFLRQFMDSFLERNSFARHLAGRMRKETGTDFFEWIDHLVLQADVEQPLRACGMVAENVETMGDETVLHHPRATLPRVIISEKPGRMAISLRPEFVADFVAAYSLEGPIQGGPYSRLRRVMVCDENGARLEALERNAYRGFVPAPLHSADLKKMVDARDAWRARRRHCASPSEGFEAARVVLDQTLDLVGEDLACQYFFQEERRYWESRNRAAQLQKRRQDALGLGWGNHDHHTFRCSREHFVDAVELLTRLGFDKRERFYAGAEAGWGAQISEQSNTGIVVFADVDLRPEENEVDFSTQRLVPAAELGTVGLWVGLHGESMLEAGMHHLEARFDFEELRAQLESQGVRTMKPFSNFEFLRQAFTEGERWPVRTERVAKLRQAGQITAEQAERFSREGALGSHLENLQRRGGFKGFNQNAVSVIISATDPRKNLQAA